MSEAPNRKCKHKHNTKQSWSNTGQSGRCGMRSRDAAHSTHAHATCDFTKLSHTYTHTETQRGRSAPEAASPHPGLVVIHSKCCDERARQNSSPQLPPKIPLEKQRGEEPGYSAARIARGLNFDHHAPMRSSRKPGGMDPSCSIWKESANLGKRQYNNVTCRKAMPPRGHHANTTMRAAIKQRRLCSSSQRSTANYDRRAKTEATPRARRPPCLDRAGGWGPSRHVRYGEVMRKCHPFSFDTPWTWGGGHLNGHASRP